MVDIVSAFRKASTKSDQPHLEALIQEATREEERMEERLAVLESGGTLEPIESEHLFALVSALSQSRDPRVIDALVLHIDTGNVVINALSAFGDLAVEKVAAVALRNGTTLSNSVDTSSALMTLERIADRFSQQGQLSDDSRRLIVDAARYRLSGIQNAVVLRHAIELAVATGDTVLIEQVRIIALGRAAVEVFGVTDPKLVRRVQETAEEALNARNIR